MQSLDPRLKGTSSATSTGSGYESISYTTATDSATDSAVTATQRALDEIKQQLFNISEEARKDPKRALAHAMTLPDAKVAGIFSPRVRGLFNVARLTTHSDPHVSKTALEELRKHVENVDFFEWGDRLIQSTEVYQQMGDLDDAKKTLTEAAKAADKMYERDSNADDPNLAFKGTWPSANLYWACIRLGAGVSPDLANQTLAGIDDPEIAAYERVSYALTLIGKSHDWIEMAEQHKDGDGTIAFH